MAKAGDVRTIVEPASWTVEAEAVPQGETVLHFGAEVHATDGRIGKVDEFLVEKRTGRITHLVLKEGHLWRAKEITVPASCIAGYDKDVVRLTLDKKAVELLPTAAAS